MANDRQAESDECPGMGEEVKSYAISSETLRKLDSLVEAAEREFAAAVTWHEARAADNPQKTRLFMAGSHRQDSEGCSPNRLIESFSRDLLQRFSRAPQAEREEAYRYLEYCNPFPEEASAKGR